MFIETIKSGERKLFVRESIVLSIVNHLHHHLTQRNRRRRQTNLSLCDRVIDSVGTLEEKQLTRPGKCVLITGEIGEVVSFFYAADFILCFSDMYNNSHRTPLMNWGDIF